MHVDQFVPTKVHPLQWIARLDPWGTRGTVLKHKIQAQSQFYVVKALADD